jgi:hypothetical protein
MSDRPPVKMVTCPRCDTPHPRVSMPCGWCAFDARQACRSLAAGLSGVLLGLLTDLNAWTLGRAHHAPSGVYDDLIDRLCMLPRSYSQSHAQLTEWLLGQTPRCPAPWERS